MQTVICSHGFGVRADGRGLFTDLAAALPDYTFVTFDYNDIQANGDILVPPLDEQADKLQRVVNEQPAGSTLLCHSMGCIVAGLVNLERINKVVLLAPPTTAGIQKFFATMLERPDSRINLHGVSMLQRADGTTTLVPASFMKSIELDPFALYQQIAERKPTLIIRATQDDVIGLTDVSEIRLASHADIAADHNFSGSNRGILIRQLQQYL